MKFLKTKIKEISWNDEFFILQCEDKVFKFKIKDGTVDIKIFTFDKEEVGINYLEKDDIIKVELVKKNNIYTPSQIFVNTKFVLNSDSENAEI